MKGSLGNQEINISIKCSISELKHNIVVSLALINNHLVNKVSLTDFDWKKSPDSRIIRAFPSLSTSLWNTSADNDQMLSAPALVMTSNVLSWDNVHYKLHLRWVWNMPPRFNTALQWESIMVMQHLREAMGEISLQVLITKDDCV